MRASQNLFALGPASADEEERQNIARALGDTDVLMRRFQRGEDLLKLSTTIVPSSRFDDESQAGKILLNAIRKNPEFSQLTERLDIDVPHWTMIRDNGEVYEGYESVGSTDVYIEYVIITDEVYEIESLRDDIELVSKSAVRTGGIVSSNAIIPLRHWLAFQQLDKPQTSEDWASLNETLNFKLPAPPKFGNYWGYSDATQDTALIVDSNQHSVIVQEVRKLMAGQRRDNEPLINYLTDVLLKKWSGALVMEEPRRAWEILMETNEARHFAQACFDALKAQGSEQTRVLTDVTRSRLILAAVVLDLDMGCEERVETHRGLRYAPLHVHEHPSEARNGLKRHFEQINRAQPFAAHLATELVLAGQSPEFLVISPSTLLIGSPGWVMLRKAVLLSERIAPGLSLMLSYQQLMKFAALMPLSDEQRKLHQLLSLQCVMDWAYMNELTPVNDEGPSVEHAATAAMNHYSAYANELSNALAAITAAPTSRRELAKRTLFDAGINDLWEVFSSPHNKGGLFADTVINLYLANQTYRTNLKSKSSKRNLHDAHPRLQDLEPVNTLYAEKLKPQHEKFKSGISTMIRLAFSKLGLNDREALTQGKLTLYLVRGNRNIPNHSADHFSPHGVVILCRHKSKTHCFELFPLQGLCRKSERLAEAYFGAAPFNESTGAFDETTNANNENFPRLTYLENIISEHEAYFKGAAPSHCEHSAINRLLPRHHWQLEEHEDIREFGMLLDRFGEFSGSDEPAACYSSPMTSFHSDSLLSCPYSTLSTVFHNWSTALQSW